MCVCLCVCVSLFLLQTHTHTSTAPTATTISPESDFVAPREDELFKSLDLNNDGVLTRDEVSAGASRFGLTAAEAQALFDRLDANGDGVLTPTEFAGHAWDVAVSKYTSFASPESDFSAVRSDDLFKSLDKNDDGVLTRGEVASGAHLFNMNAAVLLEPQSQRPS